MTTPTSPNDSTAAAHSVRPLYVLYMDLAREFMIDLPACDALEKDEEVTPEISAAATAWFLDADQRIPVHQLRQFLQTSTLATLDCLRAALEHHLDKSDRTSADRDKIDFMLVQFFALSAASHLQDADASLDFVARTLEPVLGKVEPALPESLHQLEELAATAGKCQSLQAMFNGGILDHGRSLKVSSGDSYFEPNSLVAFTRFNFLLRRAFFRLMHHDLNAILAGLRELEQRGVDSLDCRAAEFSADEPVSRLRLICQSWKVMFQAEYSSGQPLRLLVDLRAVVDSRLAQDAADSAGSTPSSAEPLSKAAAASGDSSASDEHTSGEVAPAGDDKE